MLGRHDRILPWIVSAVVLSCAAAGAAVPRGGPALVETIDGVQSKVVKIYGAGGFRGLEAYQSGLVISAEGHVLTVWSYVLDTDFLTATLSDGRKFDARLVGADPRRVPCPGRRQGCRAGTCLRSRRA